VLAPHGLPAGVVVGVRPEYARPWADGLIGPLEGRVEYVEALGRETFVGVRTGPGTLLVAQVEGRARPRPGDPFRIGLVGEGLRFFDPGSGAALAAHDVPA
jgi:ABC-type sugar transport system ATPase subunit